MLFNNLALLCACLNFVYILSFFHNVCLFGFYYFIIFMFLTPMLDVVYDLMCFILLLSVASMV